MRKINKNKKTKGNRILIGYIVFLIIVFLLGLLAGLISGNGADPFVNFGNKLLMLAGVLMCVYAAVFIMIIVHEGGHLIFGKLSGYSFVSFRIGNLMFIKDNGHIKLKKFTVVGTGGQCLMMPPECDDYDYPYLSYNLGGVISNIFFSILCLILLMLFHRIFWLSVFLVISFFIGTGFTLLNGIPLKIGGIVNDGYNTILLNKNEEARHAFWLQLHINGLIAEGMRLRDMPDEWFRLPDNADLTNPIVCVFGVLRFSYFYDKQEFDNARSIGEFMLKNASGMLEVHKNELRCELLFLEIIGECRKEEIDSLYTKELRKYIKATSYYISRKRLMYAYELLVNKNEEGAQKQLSAFEKTAKTYPFRGEVESEREIIDLITTMLLDLQS